MCWTIRDGCGSCGDCRHTELALGRVQIVESISHLKVLLDEPRRNGRIIGFVPTLGALHAGHRRLIERAREDCQFVAVSIFVNPLQFERKDDLELYPRDLEADLTLCQGANVDIVFIPSVAELYSTFPMCVVDVGPLADHLPSTEGACHRRKR